MIDDFSYYKKLNVKKVIIVIAIAVLLIVSITVFIISKTMKNGDESKASAKQNTESKTEIFTDTDKTISIELANKYGLKQSHNSEYLIKLSSDSNMDVYISKIEKMENRPLASVARADKLAYLEEYNAYSNLSDLKELSVNGNQAYTYSFHYLDENLRKAFYIQVVLLELDDAIYLFDIDFPLDDLTLYTNLATEVLETFTKY
jgi:hypothetical protein